MNAIKRRLNDSAAMRWGMLFLIATTTFATYYIYDIFSGMKGIMETQLGINSADYGFLLGSISFFNIIGMILVGGIVLDKFGIRKTGFFFIGIASFGALLIAIGGTGAPNFKLMVLGRVFFGLGLETCCVLVQKVIVKWFKGKELALAFAINMGVGRFGSFFTIMLAPRLAGDLVGGKYPEFANPLWVGFALTAMALVFFLVYCMFDVKIDKELAGDQETKDAAAEEKTKAEELQGMQGFKKFKHWFRGTGLIDLMTDKSFLFIAALCVIFYSAVFPFMGYAQDMLVNKFGFNKNDAATISGFIPLGTILFTPIFGWLVDKKGKSASLMIVGSVTLIFAHLMLSLTSVTPYIALLALGVSFSLVPAAMWPSVARIVPENRLGIAYSMMFTIQNYGTMAFAYLIGKVLVMTNPGVNQALIDAGKANYNYTTTILMLAILGFIGIIFAFLLKRQDKVSNYGLELPFYQKEEE